MTNQSEFESTRNFNFEITANQTETLQSRLLLKAYELATHRGFSSILTTYFYLFRDIECPHELTIECDILDVTDHNIAIDCYLYKRDTTTFIAKSFSIFTKYHDPY